LKVLDENEELSNEGSSFQNENYKSMFQPNQRVNALDSWNCGFSVNALENMWALIIIPNKQIVMHKSNLIIDAFYCPRGRVSYYHHI
jgi:hypothetical protein